MQRIVDIRKQKPKTIWTRRGPAGNGWPAFGARANDAVQMSAPVLHTAGAGLTLQRSTRAFSIWALAFLVALVNSPILFAFEAHVVNVTATIERKCPTNIDFSTDSLGNAIAAGQKIDGEYLTWGLLIHAENGHLDHPDLAIAFDSANPTGGDFDLGTPHSDFGGPGIGFGGAQGMPGENALAQGNLLVIAENATDGNGDGNVDVPDDEASGGTIYFSYATGTLVESIRAIDIEEQGGVIELYDTNDNSLGTIAINPEGDNSAQTIAINTAGVKEMRVVLAGSGAVDDLCFQPVPQYCEYLDTRSYGYWKNHPEQRIFPQTLGASVISTQGQANTVFNISPNNALNRLRAQLLALKFSIAYFGSGPGYVPGEVITVSELAAEADQLLISGGTNAQYTAMKDRIEVVNIAHQVIYCELAEEGGVGIQGETLGASVASENTEVYEEDNSSNTPPEIDRIGRKLLVIEQDSEFTDPGATADDEEDGDLSASVVVEGSVDTATPGLYTLIYRVTDSGGLTAEAVRTVEVESAGDDSEKKQKSDDSSEGESVPEEDGIEDGPENGEGILPAESDESVETDQETTEAAIEETIILSDENTESDQETPKDTGEEPSPLPDGGYTGDPESLGPPLE